MNASAPALHNAATTTWAIPTADHLLESKLSLEHIKTFDAEFGGIAALVLGPHGNVFVADFLNQEITEFNSLGEPLRRFGREGEGPGEFRGLRDISVLHDTLVAFDHSLDRLTVFPLLAPGSDPVLISLFPDAGRIPNYGIMADTSPGILVQFAPPQRPAGLEPGANRTIVFRRIGLTDGDVLDDSVFSTPDREWLVTTSPQYGYAVSLLPFGRRPVVRTLSDGRILYGWSGSPMLQIVQSNGHLDMEIHLPLQPRPVEARHFEMLKQSYVDFIGPGAARLVYGRIQRAFEADRLPKTLPLFDDIRVDDHGRIWVRLISAETNLASTSTGLRYVRYIPSGRGGDVETLYLVLDMLRRRVQMIAVPGDVLLAGFSGNYAYGIVTSDLDVQQVAIFSNTSQ